MSKNHNFGQILTFWGLLHRPPFTDEGQIWCAIADAWYTLTCQISSRSVYSVPYVGENPNFCHFWTWAFSGVANWQQSDTVEYGCTTTNLPLSNGIKIVSDSNACMAKSGAQSQTFKSVTNNRQTDKKLNVFGHTLAAGEIRAPPNLAW